MQFICLHCALGNLCTIVISILRHKFYATHTLRYVQLRTRVPFDLCEYCSQNIIRFENKWANFIELNTSSPLPRYLRLCFIIFYIVFQAARIQQAYISWPKSQWMLWLLLVAFRRSLNSGGLKFLVYIAFSGQQYKLCCELYFHSYFYRYCCARN